MDPGQFAETCHQTGLQEMRRIPAEEAASSEPTGESPSCQQGSRRAVYDIARRMRIASLWGERSLHSPPHPTVALATSHAEVEAIGRLRYELLFEGSRNCDPHMDHARRLFIEPLDDLSLHVCARVEGRLMAAVRLSRGQDAIFDPQMAAMLRASVPAMPPFADCLTVSQLVVRCDRGARAQIAGLIRFAYRIGLATGMARFAVFGTQPSHRSLFERLGGVPTGSLIADPTAGEMAILALRMHDRDHLQAIGSPLLTELDRYRQEQAERKDEEVGATAAAGGLSGVPDQDKARRFAAGACHLTGALHLPS